MLTEDYIMRMINQVLAVFLQALNLKKAGQPDEALQAFDQAVESLLGIRPSLVKQLEDRQLLTLLTFQEKLDVDRLLVLADIYYEEGEVYTMLRQPEQFLFAAQRSLRLYLEACLATESNLTHELAQKIETQRSRLSVSNLTMETRLALMDYFDRLLASREDYLTAIGFSRPYIQATLTSLENADLD
jgi:tetratricopeptide (TPR) repeat protein